MSFKIRGMRYLAGDGDLVSAGGHWGCCDSPHGEIRKSLVSSESALIQGQQLFAPAKDDHANLDVDEHGHEGDDPDRAIEG